MKKMISILLTVSLFSMLFTAFAPVGWLSTAVKASAATNETLSIVPEADAEVHTYKTEKQLNYGANTTMTLQYNAKLNTTSTYNAWLYHPSDPTYDSPTDTTDLKVGYMCFDLSGIDTTKGIKKAELKVSSSTDLSAKTFKVFSVDDITWKEGAGAKNGTSTPATDAVQNDGSSGINFYGRPPLGSQVGGGTGAIANTFSLWDISDYVRKTYSNNKMSIALESDSSNTTAKYSIYSKDDTNAAHRPSLLITYYTADEIANGVDGKTSEQIKLEMDYTALSVPAFKTQDDTLLTLPTHGTTTSAAAITWTSSDRSTIGDGTNGTTLGQVDQTNAARGKSVTLTATVAGYGSKTFVVTIAKPVDSIASSIKSIAVPVKNATSLTMPTVPAGYTIAVKSASPSGIIGADGKLTLPDVGTSVAVVFTVTNTTDGSTADTASINVMVPSKLLTWDSTQVPTDTWNFMTSTQFDGVNTFINAGSTIGSTSDLTVAFKMTPSKLANMIPVDKSPATGTAGWSIKLRDTGSIWFRLGSNATCTDIIATGAYSAGKQVSVAFTFDSVNSTAKIYVDGSLVTTQTSISGKTVNDTITNLRLGISSINNSTTEQYQGALGNVHIYDKVLTDTQINMLYSEPIVTASTPTVTYTGSTSAPDHKLSLWYQKPATSWSKEALPIGNSYMGGMIFGDVANDRIQYNDKTLWEGGPVNGDPSTYDNGNTYATAYTHLDSVRTKLFNGDNSGAENEMDSYMVGNGTKSVIGSKYGSYQTFGDIYIKAVLPTDKTTAVTNYRRELDLEDGVARTFYTIDGVNYKREYFCSYPDNVMVIRLTSDAAGKLNFGITPTSSEFTNATTEGDDTIVTRGNLSKNNLLFESRIKVINEGGTRTAGLSDILNGQINVSNANSVTIIMTTGTNYAATYPTYRGADPHDDIVARINAAAVKGYDALLQIHENDYKPLFNRVELDLGDSTPTIPTDQLRSAYPKVVDSNNNMTVPPDKSLEVLMYQMGRYMLIASSRSGTLPANLQGVWNDSNSVTWQSDYHFNINIQMNYWPAEVANLSECVIPLVDYTKSLVEPGRITAADYFGVTGGGWAVNTMTNPFGSTAPGFKSSWGWAPNSNAFISNNLWEHYQFTGDKEYLKNTIYPIMKEAAEFWTKWLIEDKDGTLVSSPSYSPEHGPNGDNVTPSVTIGDAMDQQLAYDLFTNVINASETLGIDETFRNELIDKRSKLSAPVKVGEWGQVQEWKDDLDDPTNTHRHLSELTALYPGNLINVNTPEWLEAAKVKMRHRSGLTDGSGWTSTAITALDALPGWSKADKLNLWARAHDGNSAYITLNSQLRSTTYSNLFDYHKGPELFQIDGNLGYVSGVSEMLVQSQAGNIELLPALPDAWSSGSVDGLVARGNFEVGVKWNANKLQEATIKSNLGNKCIVKNSEFKDNIKLSVLKASDSSPVTYTIDSDTILFETVEGESYKIIFSETTASAIKELNDAIDYADTVDFNSVAADISKIDSSIKNDFDAAYATAVSALNNAKDTLLVSIDDAVNYAKNLIDRTNDIKTAIKNAENEGATSSTTMASVTITGNLKVGKDLEAKVYDEDQNIITSGLSCQWYRLKSKDDAKEDGTEIGTDESTYSLTNSDKEFYIMVEVTYGEDVVDSKVVGPITKKSSSSSTHSTTSIKTNSSSSTLSSDSSSLTSDSGSKTNTPSSTLITKADGTVELTNTNGQPLTGWQQIDGNWYLADETGTAKTGWQQESGKWYLLSNDGTMETGWQLVNNKWYLMAQTGAMKTGWQQEGGKWYYLYTDGEMARNTTIEGYTLGSDGAWIQ